jgi:hypothetical protein
MCYAAPGHPDQSAQRLKRVFSIDSVSCSECGGAVKVIASIEDPAVISKILAHLDGKAVSPAKDQLPEWRAPRQAGLFEETHRLRLLVSLARWHERRAA